MEYLEAPIGNDQFVCNWLEKKTKELKKIIDILSLMPHKHKAATLLKSTAAVCRVVYLMRILPPTQTSAFIEKFDTIVRSGFEKILGIPINDLWWDIAKLPPKYGGMGWKTGSHTYGAHYVTSLAKTTDSVRRIIPDHDPASIAEYGATKWMQHFAPPDVTIKSMIKPSGTLTRPRTHGASLRSTSQPRDNVMIGFRRNSYQT